MGDGWCIGVIVVMVHVLGPESGGCLPLSSGEDRPLGGRTYSSLPQCKERRHDFGPACTFGGYHAGVSCMYLYLTYEWTNDVVETGKTAWW